MTVTNQSSFTTNNILSSIGIVLGLSLIFVVIPLMLSGAGSSGGKMGEDTNILSRGRAVVSLLNKYVGDTLGYSVGIVNWNMMLYIVQAITILLTLVPILTLALPSSELTTGNSISKGNKMEATELAYGKLAYVDSDAKQNLKKRAQ